MIAEIRNHIKTSIKACDSRYLEIDDPFFDVSEVAGDRVDLQYAIRMGASTAIINDDLGNAVEIPVTLTLFRQGGDDKSAVFDEGFTHALIIKDVILDITSIINKDYIKGIKSSSVSPGEVEDSQDIYSYEITFIFTISYGIEE